MQKLDPRRAEAITRRDTARREIQELMKPGDYRSR
jgi:hypothetical protein